MGANSSLFLFTFATLLVKTVMDEHNQILLVDSGSTKTQWRVVTLAGATLEEFFTEGINPALMPAATVDAAINAALRKRRLAPARVYYYGAGCTPDRVFMVKQTLRRLYPQALVEVRSDLYAAIHALCGMDEGIACILGTGMASCLCKGGEVVQQTPSLGYLLGDEGSGAVLGRKLVGAVLKGALSPEVCEAWNDEYRLSAADVIGRVYREPQANRFLASFAPFIAKHIEETSVRDMVTAEFCHFFRRNIAPYQRRDLPVNFVGGIAANFKAQICEAARQEGFEVGKVMQAPMDALAGFYAC